MRHTNHRGVPEHIQKAIRDLGYASVLDYAEAHPLVSLNTLSEPLGPEVPGIVLEECLKRDCLSAERFPWFVRDQLCRRLARRFPDGLRPGPRYNFLNAAVWAEWGSLFFDNVDVEQLETAYDAILADVPLGWLPSGPDDPRLLSHLHSVEYTPEDPDSSMSC